MGGSRFTPEVRAEHLERFGPTLGPLYGALSSDVLWLHSKWLEYRKLYGGSPQRVELLNSMAPYFFWLLQSVLWDDVLLHLARLTDPPRQGAFENLSLLCLSDAIPDSQVAAEVADLTASAVLAASFAREYRNKRLAHNDLTHALEQAEPLSLGSRQDVEDALSSFVVVLNTLNSHYAGATLLYREVSGLGDAESLVHDLALAARVEAQRRTRLEAGTSLPEDFEHPSVP